MQHIETVTVGSGGAASITFSAIPDTFTDLLLVCSLRATTDVSNWTMSFNGSTSNFTMRQLFGNGSSASSNSLANSGGAYGVVNPSTATASTFANASLYIPNYAGSTNKSFSVDGVSENNATTAYQTIAAGLWSQTAAITSISFTPSGGGNYVEHSSISLFGITAGSDGIVAVS